VETVVILSLTVALAAGVVWWVTSGQIPSFFTGRRGGRPTTPPLGSEGNLGIGTSAVTRSWPRQPVESPRRRSRDAPRGAVVRHRSSRGAFTYAPPVRDHRPPVLFTLAKIVFMVALVAALLALGIWAVGDFVTSLVDRVVLGP
jgi:hypothetical protein